MTQLVAAPSRSFRSAALARPARVAWRLPAGWPVCALLCLYPIWWLLGIGQFAFVIFAIPMVRHLWRARPIRVPAGFGLWILFLIWNVITLVMIPASAPAAHSGSLLGGIVSISLKFMQLSTATITLLYVCNLPLADVTQRRLLKWMSVLFVVTVAGGLLALASPHFQFESPVERIMPHAVRSNSYARALVHPNAAQVQDVLGYSAPRPAAPWSYTNYWANNLSILLVWFCLYMWSPSQIRRRLLMTIVLIAAIITTVYSLNRGLWFGLIASFLFVMATVARRGDVRSILAALALVPVLGIAFYVTPLHTVVGQRASHGNSNQIRAYLDKKAVTGALASPVVGWGETRKTQGSASSIAVGKSSSCEDCGQPTIGSTGEIWEIIYTKGFVGALLYLAFFVAIWWRLRRDTSAIGAGARLIVWLSIFYTIFYNNLPVALTLVMISIGISWRNIAPKTPVKATDGVLA